MERVSIADRGRCVLPAEAVARANGRALVRHVEHAGIGGARLHQRAENVRCAGIVVIAYPKRSTGEVELMGQIAGRRDEDRGGHKRAAGKVVNPTAVLGVSIGAAAEMDVGGGRHRAA